jgi:membrane protein involved in colicin uptake
MNQRKQDMQETIRKAEAEEAAKQKAAADAKAKADAAAHKEAQATGGDYHSGHQSTVDGQTTDWGDMSHMIARGGLAQHAPRYANGGLIDFYRYGGFIG